MGKRFLLIPNTQKDNQLSFTKELIAFLTAQKQEICVYPNIRESFHLDLETYCDDGSADAAVVIGGDGTILHCAHRLIEQHTPILGINFGRLGFLAEVEPASACGALQKIIDGQYQVERRMVLNGHIEFDDGTARDVFAVNDLVLHRNEISGILPVRASINGTLMDTFLCDGVIASTPSGSTAYNFSAGGAIVNPIAQNILFTPICSHSVLGRCIVATGNDSFCFETDQADETGCPNLNIDGIEKIPLSGKCSITVTKSKHVFLLVHVTNMSFYEILHKKMFG